MKPDKHRQRERGRNALELIEEAVHLLRLSPGPVLAVYYIGALPFILGLLWFWADMSHSAIAYQHLVPGSLGVAALFVWMKFWQTLFALQLRARVSAVAPAPLSAARALRIVIQQTILQPAGFVLLPLSVICGGLPLAWVFAFFQNAIVLCDGEAPEAGPLLKRAYKQAVLWPGQNHLALAVLAGFAFCVWFNLATVCLFLPHLVKIFTGIESVYTESIFSMLNTTFFAATFGLAYLCVDPIIKAVYLLRCFYGESVQSGADLKAELQQFSLPARPAMAALLLLLTVFAGPLHAAETTNAPARPAATPTVSPPDLDRAIGKVIQKPKYTWRMPREKAAEETAADGPISRFFTRVFQTIKQWIKAALDWIGNLLDKLFRKLPSLPKPKGSLGWIGSSQDLMLILILLVATVLGVFLYRAWRRRKKTVVEPVTSAAALPTPDLADENVGAEQLPEDGWVRLGRELLGRGELRLAMRAFYFASLAHLATRNLITIARFKSNRDYERELQRRGHALTDLLPLFTENVLVFDRSWYGLHDLDAAMVDRFAANVERIKTT